MKKETKTDKVINVNFTEQQKHLHEVTPQQLYESMKDWIKYPKLKGVIIIYEYGTEEETNISMGHTPYNPFRLMGILSSMVSWTDDVSNRKKE